MREPPLPDCSSLLEPQCDDLQSALGASSPFLPERVDWPSGDPTIWDNATIEDDSKIDPADFATAEVPVVELSGSWLLYLIGSRYCETALGMDSSFRAIGS
jgi:hypothetical protein